jgi:pyruvate/2-oxoglutarate dehydrogenase complex dihydrolipoamide acyltransferase (E2) component
LSSRSFPRTAARNPRFNSYFFKTSDGTIGQGFAELSPQARQYAERHKWELPQTVAHDTGEQYQVVEKLDEAERLAVKLRHHTRV